MQPLNQPAAFDFAKPNLPQPHIASEMNNISANSSGFGGGSWGEEGSSDIDSMLQQVPLRLHSSLCGKLLGLRVCVHIGARSRRPPPLRRLAKSANPCEQYNSCDLLAPLRRKIVPDAARSQRDLSGESVLGAAGSHESEWSIPVRRPRRRGLVQPTSYLRSI
jgi:hypothetical protein